MYWCNWEVTQPTEREITLQDILEPITTTTSFLRNSEYTPRQSKRPQTNKSPMLLGYIKNINSQGCRVYDPQGKSVTISASTSGIYRINLPDGHHKLKMLTPIECERLQGLPDNYTAGVSNTQRHRQLGNGWQCDTIQHIFSCNPNLYDN